MHKILFAHSDPKLIRLYHPHLSSHFSLDSANNGLIALRKIKLNTPGLIVSDYKLPIISGLTLLKFVRKNPHTFATPFVFLSDYPGFEEALSFGANDWFLKAEMHPDLLIERIYHHLKQGVRV